MTTGLRVIPSAGQILYSPAENHVIARGFPIGLRQATLANPGIGSLIGSNPLPTGLDPNLYVPIPVKIHTQNLDNERILTRELPGDFFPSFFRKIPLIGNFSIDLSWEGDPSASFELVCDWRSIDLLRRIFIRGAEFNILGIGFRVSSDFQVNEGDFGLAHGGFYFISVSLEGKWAFYKDKDSFLRKGNQLITNSTNNQSSQNNANSTINTVIDKINDDPSVPVNPDGTKISFPKQWDWCKPPDDNRYRFKPREETEDPQNLDGGNNDSSNKNNNGSPIENNGKYYDASIASATKIPYQDPDCITQNSLGSQLGNVDGSGGNNPDPSPDDPIIQPPNGQTDPPIDSDGDNPVDPDNTAPDPNSNDSDKNDSTTTPPLTPTPPIQNPSYTNDITQPEDKKFATSVQDLAAQVGVKLDAPYMPIYYDRNTPNDATDNWNNQFNDWIRIHGCFADYSNPNAVRAVPLNSVKHWDFSPSMLFPVSSVSQDDVSLDIRLTNSYKDKPARVFNQSLMIAANTYLKLEENRLLDTLTPPPIFKLREEDLSLISFENTNIGCSKLSWDFSFDSPKPVKPVDSSSTETNQNYVPDIYTDSSAVLPVDPIKRTKFYPCGWDAVNKFIDNRRGHSDKNFKYNNDFNPNTGIPDNLDNPNFYNTGYDSASYSNKKEPKKFPRPVYVARQRIRQEIIDGDVENTGSPPPSVKAVNADMVWTKSGVTKVKYRKILLDGMPQEEEVLTFGYYGTASQTFSWGQVKREKTIHHYDPKRGMYTGSVTTGNQLIQLNSENTTKPETLQLANQMSGLNSSSNEYKKLNKKLETYKFIDVPIYARSQKVLVQFYDYYQDAKEKENPPYEVYKVCNRDGTASLFSVVQPGYYPSMFALEESTFRQSLYYKPNPDYVAPKNSKPAQGSKYLTAGEDSFHKNTIKVMPAKIKGVTTKTSSKSSTSSWIYDGKDTFSQTTKQFSASGANFQDAAEKTSSSISDGRPSAATQMPNIYELKWIEPPEIDDSDQDEKKDVGGSDFYPSSKYPGGSPIPPLYPGGSSPSNNNGSPDPESDPDPNIAPEPDFSTPDPTNPSNDRSTTTTVDIDNIKTTCGAGNRNTSSTPLPPVAGTTTIVKTNPELLNKAPIPSGDGTGTGNVEEVEYEYFVTIPPHSFDEPIKQNISYDKATSLGMALKALKTDGIISDVKNTLDTQIKVPYNPHVRPGDRCTIVYGGVRYLRRIKSVKMPFKLKGLIDGILHAEWEPMDLTLGIDRDLPLAQIKKEKIVNKEIGSIPSGAIKTGGEDAQSNDPYNFNLPSDPNSNFTFNPSDIKLIPDRTDSLIPLPSNPSYTDPDLKNKFLNNGIKTVQIKDPDKQGNELYVSWVTEVGVKLGDSIPFDSARSFM